MTQQQPTQSQCEQIAKLLQFLNGRHNKSNDRTRQELQRLGYKPLWRRVTWAGGVGSWRYMPRRKVVRMQICANVQASKQRKAFISYAGSTIRMNKKKPNGFRYAWCVEF